MLVEFKGLAAVDGKVSAPHGTIVYCFVKRDAMYL